MAPSVGFFSPEGVGTARAPRKFWEDRVRSDLITYTGHLREKRAGFSWGFSEVCPSSCSRRFCQRIKILDSSLPILECARNAGTGVSSSNRAAIIGKKAQYHLITRLKICLLAILSNRKSVTGKSHVGFTDRGFEGLMQPVIPGPEDISFCSRYRAVVEYMSCLIYRWGLTKPNSWKQSRLVIAGRWGEHGDVGQKVQTSSYKMSMSWGCSVWHSDAS